MKESKYNISLNHNGQQLIFNSKTIATAILDQPALEILDAVRRGEAIEENNLVRDMRRVGFLIDDDFNEFQQLQMVHALNRYQKSELSLVIAPTMACNFACPYCFEGSQSGVMAKHLKDKIISLISNFAPKGERLSITWFGGEPLLSKSTLYTMSQQLIDICQKENVDYDAKIITNGYLLDEDTILKLLEYKVNFAQITLDGLPETHNRKRKLKNNSGKPTFDQIIDNAILAKKHGIKVALRINVDRETAAQLEQLLDMMIEKDLADNLYLGHVQGNTDCCKEICEACLSKEDFAYVAVGFEDLRFSKNLETGYPIPIRVNCGADYLYSYVIDADGYIYKCWNDIGIKENSIGNVTELENFGQLWEKANKNYTKYMTWSPFDFKKCRDCKILPICMGGCQYNGRYAGEPVCENWKYELEKYIKLKCAGSC